MESDESVGSVRPLLPRNGFYEWVAVSNDNRSRTERRAVANETMKATDCGWYSYGDDCVPLKNANEAEASTIIVSPKGTWPDLPAKRRYKSTDVKYSDPGTYVLDVAAKLVEQGEQVAAVSAASAHHVGGGFTSGGRHASEEALCVQSTLYRCLRHAWRQTGVPEGSAYIPEDGVVLCRQVEVFREGTFRGYAPLPTPWELACVVSVAMPNLNERVRDAPLWKPASSREYRTALLQRWRAALHAAVTAGASHVVCPDAGCGVYRNDPKLMGTVLGELLCAEFFGHFQALWLVGSEAFQAAVRAKVDSHPKESLGKTLKNRLSKRIGSSDKTDKPKEKPGMLASDCSPERSELKVDTALATTSGSKLRLPWTPNRGRRAIWKRMMSSSTTASSADLDDLSVSEVNISLSRQLSPGTPDECSTGTSGTGEVTPFQSPEHDKVSVHRHDDMDAALLKSKLEALCTDACKRNSGIVSLGELPQTRETLPCVSSCNKLDSIDDMSKNALAPKASARLKPGKHMMKAEEGIGDPASASSGSENEESCARTLHNSANFNPGVQRNCQKISNASVSYMPTSI